MMTIAKVNKWQTEIELEEVFGLFDIALEEMQKPGKVSLGDKPLLYVITAVRDASKNWAEGQDLLYSIKQAINDSMDQFQYRQIQIGRVGF